MVLGIDTSGRHGSIALLACESARLSQGAQSAILKSIELVLLGEGRASELLVPAIDALLARHDVERRSLSLVVVASGPGSFTGLRVAVATAKGLAEAFAIPVVAVSVLEAVALASDVQGRVLSAIDAQRGELFFGEYPVEAGRRKADRLREAIATVEEFVSTQYAVAGAQGIATNPPRICTPDAALAARIREAEPALEVSVVRHPNAEDFARIGYAKFLGGELADVASLDANYLRRSDAEIVAARKPQV